MIQSANKPPERKDVAPALRECTHVDEKAGSGTDVSVVAKCSPVNLRGLFGVAHMPTYRWCLASCGDDSYIRTYIHQCSRKVMQDKE